MTLSDIIVQGSPGSPDSILTNTTYNILALINLELIVILIILWLCEIFFMKKG